MDSIVIGNLCVNAATTHSQISEEMQKEIVRRGYPIDRYSRTKNLRKMQQKGKECYKRGFWFRFVFIISIAPPLEFHAPQRHP